MSQPVLIYPLLLMLAVFWQDDFDTYEEIVPGTESAIVMVPVKGSTYAMGTPQEAYGFTQDEGPVHEVQVGDFWMGQFEISWEQYEAFVYRKDIETGFSSEALAIDGVSSATSPYVDMSNGMGKSGYPAIGMTQYAAITYCKWLSAKTGHFYRLPTEAEWEYACRAAAPTVYSFGDDPASLAEYGVYSDNSNYAYARTGSKKPNAFDLYDMQGNVSEWTMDQYSETYYQDSPENNPWNRPETLYPRVVRGGSYKDDATDCRCTARGHSKASWKRLDPQIPKSRWWHTNAFFVGFRVVRPRETPSPEEIERYWLEAIDDYGN